MTLARPIYARMPRVSLSSAPASSSPAVVGVGEALPYEDTVAGTPVARARQLQRAPSVSRKMAELDGLTSDIASASGLERAIQYTPHDPRSTSLRVEFRLPLRISLSAVTPVQTPVFSAGPGKCADVIDDVLRQIRAHFRLPRATQRVNNARPASPASVSVEPRSPSYRPTSGATGMRPTLDIVGLVVAAALAVVGGAWLGWSIVAAWIGGAW